MWFRKSKRLGALVVGLALALLGVPVEAEAGGARSLFDDPAARAVAPAAVPNWWALQTAERAWMKGVDLPDPLAGATGGTLRLGLALVNRRINARPYRRDGIRSRQANSWAAPSDFFAIGGDCEDFAIAKYFALRAMGLSGDVMRIVVVRDRQRGQDHAVLLVRDGAQDHVLDNLRGEIVPWRTVEHYQPVYSVNELGAWLHYGDR